MFWLVLVAAVGALYGLIDTIGSSEEKEKEENNPDNL